MIGSIAKHYPDEVRNVVLPIITNFGRLGLPEYIINSVHFEELMCKKALERFLGDGEVYLEMDEMIEFAHKAMIMTSVDELINAGLMNTIDDENGQEIVWLTDKGKELMNHYMDGDVTESELLKAIDNDNS